MRQGKVSILGAIQKNYIVLTGDATLELNKRYIADNSIAAVTPGRSLLNASSATVLGYSNTNLGAWTASGVKSFAGQFFYEID